MSLEHFAFFSTTYFSFQTTFSTISTTLESLQHLTLILLWHISCCSLVLSFPFLSFYVDSFYVSLAYCKNLLIGLNFHLCPHNSFRQQPSHIIHKAYIHLSPSEMPIAFSYLLIRIEADSTGFAILHDLILQAQVLTLI